MSLQEVNNANIANKMYSIMKAAPVIEDEELTFVTENPGATMNDFENIIMNRFALPFYCGVKESNSSNDVSVSCMYFVKLMMMMDDGKKKNLKTDLNLYA